MPKMTLKDLEDWIEKRKKDLGLSGNGYVMANSGVNRTLEKRKLLDTINQNANRYGRIPPFKNERLNK